MFYFYVCSHQGDIRHTHIHTHTHRITHPLTHSSCVCLFVCVFQCVWIFSCLYPNSRADGLCNKMFNHSLFLCDQQLPTLSCMPMLWEVYTVLDRSRLHMAGFTSGGQRNSLFISINKVLSNTAAWAASGPPSRISPLHPYWGLGGLWTLTGA